MKIMKKVMASSLMAMMMISGSLVRVEATEDTNLELTNIISFLEANDVVAIETETLKNTNLELMVGLENTNTLYGIRIAYLDELIQISQMKLEKIESLKAENFLQAAFLTVTGGYEKLELSDQLAAIHSDLKSFEKLEEGVLKEDDRLMIAAGLEEKITVLEEEKVDLTRKISENIVAGVALDEEIAELTEKISAVASEVETLSARRTALEEEIREEAARVEEERQRQLEIERQKANSFVMPTSGRLTSSFGNRVHPVTGKYSFHSGIDLANSSGTSIKASRNGTVTFAGKQGSYGNFIIVRHSDGFESAYAHLSSIQVSAGQSVTQGEQIGKMGTTGRSTGSHLHFEIRKNGTAVNPYSYLN